MKKTTIVALAFCLVTLLAQSASAGFYTGTWNPTTSPALLNGPWEELYGGPGGSGGPGSVGSELIAFDSTAGASQWYFSGALLTSVSGTGPYTTTYSGGTLILQDNQTRWGDYREIYDMNVVNTSSHDGSGLLHFGLIATGTDGTFNYDITATYDGPDPATSYWFGQPWAGHGGRPFTTLQLEISQVPIPGALVLLGSGLLGLIGIGRRFHQ